MLLKRTEKEKMSMKMKKKNGWWTIKRRLMEFIICFQFIPIRVDKIHSDESGEYEWNESKRITMCWKEMIRKFKSHSDDSQSNQNERKVKWIREESHWTTIKSSRMNEINISREQSPRCHMNKHRMNERNDIFEVKLDQMRTRNVLDVIQYHLDCQRISKNGR